MNGIPSAGAPLRHCALYFSYLTGLGVWWFVQQRKQRAADPEEGGDET